MRFAMLLCAAFVVAACDSDDGDDGAADGTTGTTGAGDQADHTDLDPDVGDVADDGDDGDDGSGDAGDTAGDTGDTTGADGESDGADGSTGSPADTWENWALPEFFEVYCNQCHPAAGQSTRDFSDYATVVENVEHIRCGVAPKAVEGCDGSAIEPGHLPIGPGPYPDDETRWRLVDWIDAGMPMD